MAECWQNWRCSNHDRCQRMYSLVERGCVVKLTLGGGDEARGFLGFLSDAGCGLVAFRSPQPWLISRVAKPGGVVLPVGSGSSFRSVA